MQKPTQKIALLGLGIMGSGMASNLLKAGFPLAIYNRTRSKAEPFAAQGARVASAPCEAAQGVDVIISMVGDDDASRSVWLGVDGARLPRFPRRACTLVAGGYRRGMGGPPQSWGRSASNPPPRASRPSGRSWARAGARRRAG